MFRITKKSSFNSSDSAKKDCSNIVKNETASFLNGLRFFVLSNGMGKNRCELFKDSISKYGGMLMDDSKQIDANELISSKENDSATIKFIFIVDENTIKTWDNFEKSMQKKKFFQSLKSTMEKNQRSCFRIVTSLWLTECIKQKRLIQTTSFELKAPEISSTESEKNETSVCLKRDAARLHDNLITSDESDKEHEQTKKIKIDADKKLDSKRGGPQRNHVADSAANENSSFNESESEEDEHHSHKSYFNERAQKFLGTNAWTCAHSSKEQKANLHKQITDKLEEMSAIYESINDKVRSLAYQKAALALKRVPNQIKSKEEARSIPGVGTRIGDKIWEIVSTGDLSKLNHLREREDIRAIKLFTNMHGIGPTSAQSFVSQGFRTLEDLRSKAKLTYQQQIGLKYYHEFIERIPREEVARIEKIVKEAALSLNPELIVQACGSYRRGKATCGDVDILLTHSDGHSHRKVFPKLIKLLHESNFLTDDLVTQDDANDSHKKYLGVCQLPEQKSLHRRLDIIAVPYDEYACALLYFTGSAHFNRSMRHLARKLGYSLSEKSLNKNVIRKGSEKLNIGERFPIRTEEDIFKVLNLTYRKPEERDF